jgi:hypothetical protein
MTKLAFVPTLQKNETLQSLECEELFENMQQVQRDNKLIPMPNSLSNSLMSF